MSKTLDSLSLFSSQALIFLSVTWNLSQPIQLTEVVLQSDSNIAIGPQISFQFRSLKAFVHWTVPTEILHLLTRVYAVLCAICPAACSILDQYNACSR